MIVQVLMALPKMISMIASVVKAVKEMQAKMKEGALAEAVLKAQSAQTKEEAKVANEEITKSIP